MYTDIRDKELELKNHLEEGEKLIWTGIPKQGVVFNWMDILLIPFSLIWGSFAIFWEYMALTSEESFLVILFFGLFGVPFVIIGLYMMIGRFVSESIRRKNTIYGLTSKRILILTGDSKKNLAFLNYKDIIRIVLKEKGDGSGTIILGSEALSALRGTGWPGVAKKLAPSFEMIQDAKKIHDQIMELKKPIR